MILLVSFLSFAGKSQETFNLTDTLFSVGQKHRLNVYYLSAGYRLAVDTVSIFELDSIFQFLSQNEQLRIEIGAHSDSRGSDSMNLKITQLRSESVKNYLVSRGLSASRITAKGYGETQLLISEEEINKYKKTDKRVVEALHQRNRRTEIKIIAI